ncbi:hypothetical protein ABIF65_005582 [Bradyrhizobium japonicum]|nr:hypothetical protein [Bradyrhizobium japonicum]MCP1782205.1 hypothetical protein [Bradyrhizobium japonicum]MCP1861625.1 hypothetical protein [Bradyrhizobium japonicum]MCP1892384.1 hypothetical protein [Bradyrhizobium japonicum]MCP1965507.1 hypothetical protein [Bradyrhizobium japonicum]
MRGDLKAGSQCATPGDKEESAKKNEDRAAKLKSEGKVEDHTTADQAIEATSDLTAAAAKSHSHSYPEVAEALEGVRANAVIDGELVAIGKDGIPPAYESV